MEKDLGSVQGILDDEDYEEIVDEEELEVMGGTGTELVFWPKDLQ